MGVQKDPNNTGESAEEWCDLVKETTNHAHSSQQRLWLHLPLRWMLRAELLRQPLRLYRSHTVAVAGAAAAAAAAAAATVAVGPAAVAQRNPGGSPGSAAETTAGRQDTPQSAAVAQPKLSRRFDPVVDMYSGSKREYVPTGF